MQRFIGSVMLNKMIGVWRTLHFIGVARGSWFIGIVRFEAVRERRRRDV